jgi:glycosyltransferase involved in cell wall biosynthesis
MNKPIKEGVRFLGGHPSGRSPIDATSPIFQQGLVRMPSGVEHWAELHLQRKPTREWFDSWLARIPNFGCGCVNNFTPILERFKPSISEIIDSSPVDQAKWFALTVDIHNAVNIDLKRPEMTLDDASKRWASPFAWKDVSGQKVGFLAVDFMRIGGTETFHATLIPRVENVIGFAVQNMIFGDTDALGVPAYHGRDAIRSLCAESDVIVSWLVNPRDYGFTGKVIMVHHGSPLDEWQARSCFVGDEIVCVSEATANHLRGMTDKPVHYIPNAVDPDRIIARNAIDLPAKKLCVWIHRFAVDKRPELAIEIANYLPADWQMVMAGGGMALQGSERVTILPPQHPGDLLTRASCFLSTSKFDGFGLSVAEAIAGGVPVVSSPAGIATEPGLATIVDHDAEPQEWAAAIVAAAQKVDRPQLPAEYQLDRHVEAWARVCSSSVAMPADERTA